MHATSRGVIVALWTATAVAAFGIGWITPPPYGPPAPDDFVASLRSALGEGDVIERWGRTSSLLERLEPLDVPEAAALYERMIPLIDSPELGAFFAAWARFDAPGAINHALSWRQMELKERREIGIRAAIQAWAQRDPSAALLAYKQIGADTPAVRVVMRQALAIGWAQSRQGQEGLADFIADLTPLHPRIVIVESVARELVRGGGAEAALGWAEPILRDEGYNAALKHSVFKAAVEWAAQWDAERTAAWTLEHSGAGYAKKSVRILAKHWGRQDGAAAMAWLGEQSAGELRDQAAREVFGQWSRAEPMSAQAWLDGEKPTALHDPALEYKAQRMVGFDPEQSLRWCERIQETARQQSCLVSTAKNWYLKNAVAAETWLQQSSLDDEARSRVRKMPKTQGTKGPRRRRPR